MYVHTFNKVTHVNTRNYIDTCIIHIHKGYLLYIYIYIYTGIYIHIYIYTYIIYIHIIYMRRAKQLSTCPVEK